MTRAKWFTSYFAQRSRPKFLTFGLLFIGMVCLILAISWINWVALFYPVQDFVYQLEASYQQWFEKQTSSHPLSLLLFAFIGGIIASISPCKLALLPVNLSYIGTRDITSRWDAFVKATAFVLGVVTVLSLLGLFSSFAGTLMLEFRGYINIAVGIIILVMGLNLWGIVQLSLPHLKFVPTSLGPYSFGLTFALVGSPCSSPVLFAVLAAATATSSQLYSTLIMISYALGDTAVIFLASLFTGLAKQTRILLNYSENIMRLAGGLLILMGGYYLVNGIRWLFLVMGQSA